jgi:hypothetical protein
MCNMNRLTAQLKAKLVTLLGQKNDVLKESHLLESLLHELSCQLDVTICPRSVLIKKTADLMQMLHDIHNKPVSHFFRGPVSTEFVSELVPKFEVVKLHCPSEICLDDLTCHDVVVIVITICGTSFVGIT